MIIKTLTGLEKRVKDITETKSEMKNTINEMKNTADKINSRQTNKIRRSNQ